MRRMSSRLLSSLLALQLLVAVAHGQAPVAQTQEDDYTRYELLAPETAQFRIYYEVTATTPGARFFFNVIRKGSVATDERVVDLSTGHPLKWEVVSGAQARKEGHPTADVDAEWIKVHLARPVPQGGEARILIDKTYKDAKSYYRQGDRIVFDRSLGIRRNSVVLPAGYRLVSCNVPSQVLTTPDGRVMISFLNTSAAAAPLMIEARPELTAAPPRASTIEGTPEPVALPSQAARLAERAHADREIVYNLEDPATHAFSLFHDYTESRPGTRHYFNVVRAGSRVSSPSAINLDSGERLQVEMLTGADLKARRLDAGEPVGAEGQVVVVSFPPVPASGSTRLRISETYTDPGRYRLDGDELVWDRAFGRARNTVVLPPGWTVVASAMPATITEDPDGRQRLYFENNRPDELQVLIRARRLSR
jgi:hypothetical protein